jgi:hypothetical protein
MLKRFGLTILLSLLGAVLGTLVAIAFIWDLLDSRWVRIEAAPEPVAALVHIERDQVWVESASGTLYKYTDAQNCRSDCWTAVNSIPDLVRYDNPDPVEVKDSTCSPALPIIGVEERIEQCHVEMWVSRNYVFALHKNGSLHFWQSDVYGEWIVVELLLGCCGGAFFVFILSMLFILLPEMLRLIRKGAKAG